MLTGELNKNPREQPLHDSNSCRSIQKINQLTTVIDESQRSKTSPQLPKDESKRSTTSLQ